MTYRQVNPTVLEDALFPGKKLDMADDLGLREISWDAVEVNRSLISGFWKGT
jgi:hypothetical protein